MTDTGASTDSTSLASQKRSAFLIASPYGNLKGPINDLEAVEELLQRHGFDILQLSGSDATRVNILRMWHQLIDGLNEHDVAVVYYSGHGGLVECAPLSSDTNAKQPDMPHRYQFLVPMDYDTDTTEDFRGLLDVEISVLVGKMTAKTKNVTIILDCCYAGRMARDSRHSKDAVPKTVPRIHIADLTRHISRLQDREEFSLLGYTNLESNQDAVRVVAAADSELAWEYLDSRSKRRGAMTKALIPALDEALAAAYINAVSSNEQESYAAVTWKTLLLRVCQLVNAEFPEQHPQVEGPYERIVLSRKKKRSHALLVTEEDDGFVIQAGLVAGVRKNDIYVLMPHNYHHIVRGQELCEARVIDVTGFRAVIRPNSQLRLPDGSALAFIKKQAVSQWPVEISPNLQDNKYVIDSPFVRPSGESNAEMSIARIVKDDSSVSIFDSTGVKLSSFQFNSDDELHYSVEDAVDRAELLARSQFLALKPSKDECLLHSLDCAFSVTSCEQVPLATDGTGRLATGDRAVIALHNPGTTEIFVSVFNVNVAGRVTHLSRGSVDGIRLPAGGRYTLGQLQHAAHMDRGEITTRGLKLSWPKDLPEETGPEVSEKFAFIVSDQRVDLRSFADAGRAPEPQGDVSQLQLLAYHLASGVQRDCEGELVVRQIKWNIVVISFVLIKVD